MVLALRNVEGLWQAGAGLNQAERAHMDLYSYCCDDVRFRESVVGFPWKIPVQLPALGL
jgi:hypothetical protein